MKNEERKMKKALLRANNITHSATSKNYEGAQLSTALSGVDDKSLHSVAHRKRRQDEQRREGFSLSSAPGKTGRNFNAPYSIFIKGVSL